MNFVSAFEKKIQMTIDFSSFVKRTVRRISSMIDIMLFMFDTINTLRFFGSTVFVMVITTTLRTSSFIAIIFGMMPMFTAVIEVLIYIQRLL